MATSTFSLAAHSSTSALEVLLAPGTQWSQKPIASLPAACAPRTYGAATSAVVARAAVFSALRRVIPERIEFLSLRIARSHRRIFVRSTMRNPIHQHVAGRLAAPPNTRPAYDFAAGTGLAPLDQCRRCLGG